MQEPKETTLAVTAEAVDGELRPTRVRWLVLGLVAFASASAYLTRYCISAAATTIHQDLGFSYEQLGKLMSGFALGYLFFQIPGGWLGNRFGTRFGFAFISIVWSLCNAWTAAASMLWVMYASRFCLGVFQAGLTPISAKILKDWIPLPNRGMSSASIGACMSVGGAFTFALTGWLLDERGYDWQGIFAAYSLVGIVWALVFYWFFRTYPQDHRGVNRAELALIYESETAGSRGAPATGKSHVREKDGSQPSGQEDRTLHGSDLFFSMLSSRSLWALCVQSFFRAAGYVFFVTWFFAFLEDFYGIRRAEAGLLNSLPLLAVVAGSLSGGVVVDLLLRTTGSKWISRSGTAFIALAICGLFTTASAWTSSAFQLSAVIAIGALFSGLASPAAWTATIDLGGRHTALFMGTMNMAGCLAGVVLPWALGAWFDQLRETGGNWNLVIYLHAAFYFAGATSWLLINPNDAPSERRDRGLNGVS